MKDTINHELKDIIRWLYANKLSLNIKKTKFMLFNIGNNKIPSSNITIKILNEKIEQIEYTKFVGVILDEKLTWRNHI